MLTVSVSKYAIYFVHYKLRTVVKPQTFPLYSHAALGNNQTRGTCILRTTLGT